MFAAALPLAIAAIAIGWSIQFLGPAPTVVVAVVAGIAGGTILGLRRPEAALLALMVVTVLLGSPIVQPEGRYLPSLVCIIATMVALAITLSAGRSLQLPARPVSLLILAYVVVGGIATVTSIDTRLSALYLSGIIASLGIAFIAAPTLLSTTTGRLAFVVTTGVIGLALAASSVVLWLLGPVRSFAEPIGIYLITELRVGEILTGVIIPRASGPYVTPGYQALNLAIGLFSLLAIRPTLGRGRRLVDLGIAIIIIATLLTMSRGGWLVVATGSLVIVVIQAMRRDGSWRDRAWTDRSALASLVVVGLALGLLLANVIGADARYDLAKIRYGDAAAGTSQEDIVTGVPVAGGGDPTSPTATPVAVRGGAESTSRGAIWSASLSAILARPITGYGPGTNADALAPFLTGPNETYRGLTSHSTWLRTALEMGIPGLLMLIGFVLASAWVVIRGLGSDRRLAEPWSTGLIASSLALVVGQLTETLLLGGLTFASLYWATAIGILVARPTGWHLSAMARRPAPPIAADGLMRSDRAV